MSIDDLIGGLPSVTEGERALKLFTDRHEFIHLFAQYINDESPKNKILFFYGDGGNGKSLLLKYLRQNYCKHLSEKTWQQIRDQTDSNLISHLQKIQPGDYTPIPSVLIDFSQNIGIERPQDPFYGLLMLRRNLGNAVTVLNHRLRFPLYDFACVWYLHKKGKSPEEIKSLFPLNEVAGLITTLIDNFSQTGVGALAKTILDFFVKDLEAKFTVFLTKRGVNQDSIKLILQKDLDTELIYELPRLFAQDLNAAMADQESLKRIVLFFDTHESFWGDQKNLPNVLFFERDEWFRRLLRALNLDSGLVVVVAGREVPRWPEARAVNPETNIPLEFIETKRIEHLSAADAKLYLKQVEITDIDLCQNLIAYASVEPDQVHPLYLGLGTDVVLQARKQGTTLTASDFTTLPDMIDKSKVLIERLLKYVNKEVRYAVHALSACRTFDFELYQKLAQELNFHPTQPDFDILVNFSFVWREEEQNHTSYRIHKLLRRLDYEEENNISQRAHAVLESHYRGQSELAEAIYHANQQDCKRGLNEWIEAFDAALQSSNYEQCRILLEIRSELSLRSDSQLGRVSLSEGYYYARLSRYSEAEQKYLDAIIAYGKTVKDNPSNINSLVNLGVVFLRLGQLQAELSKYNDALEYYERAINYCDQALTLQPEDILVLTNKGSVLDSIGQIQVTLSKYEAAAKSYEKTIATYDQALILTPDDNCLLNNKGVTLWGLGQLKARLHKHLEAIQSCKQAISAFNQALSSTPDLVQTHNNKGLAYSSLGESQVEISQEQNALESYESAIASYDQALTLAPKDIRILAHKAGVLHSLGQLEAKLLQYDNSFRGYENSITTYDLALTLAPDDVPSLVSKAHALSDFAGLQLALSMETKAIESCKLATAICEQALVFAPDHIEAYINKGKALKSLAYIYDSFSWHQLALQSYMEASSTCTQALSYAPQFADVHKNKGLLHHSMGFIHAKLNLNTSLLENEEFIESWQIAIDEFDQFLEVIPENKYISLLRNLLQQFLDNLNRT